MLFISLFNGTVFDTDIMWQRKKKAGGQPIFKWPGCVKKHYPGIFFRDLRKPEQICQDNQLSSFKSKPLFKKVNHLMGVYNVYHIFQIT
jgi:hypothetical protein